MNCSIENYINKKLNIKFKKREVLIYNTDNEIKTIFEKENFTIKHINFQNNSINGIANKKEQDYFFKILNKKAFIREITGYIKIKDKVPVSKIKEIFDFQNCNVLIYEYEDTIRKDKGLLNDFFVENDIMMVSSTKEVIYEIINLYRKNYKETSIRENYPMKEFFIKRVDSRLKRWYSDEELLNYSVTFNGIESNKTKEVIEECIGFFSINHRMECSLTQGDPNTLNIGTKPIFFDFATSGYNPIICELSTIFYSVIIADAYFCPKYHKKSYYNHEKALKNIEKFTPDIEYTIDNTNKKINIKSNIKTSKIRIEFMKEYIKMLQEVHIKISKEIIYFLIMRVLCIFDIRTMEEKDYFYSIFILHYLYRNISNDIYTSLRNIVDNFDVIGGR